MRYSASVILAHRIALDPTNVQATYFAKACGVARLVYNWGLAEWKEQYEIGGRPTAIALSRLFNAIKDEKFPFIREVTKCAPQMALLHLGYAFNNFFGGSSKYPRFKKKGKHDSFEVSGDKFSLDAQRIRIPKLGWVRMHESLRFKGRIISATVHRIAHRWFTTIFVEIPNAVTTKHDGPSVGIDFGCTNFATLSTGEKIEGPKPHKALLGRLRRLNKSLHRKVPGSHNRFKSRMKLAKLHARIANIRQDFLHKFTTDICRRFSVIGIEDLNVSGMSKNHALARSILDQTPYEMRRQFEYKTLMHGSTLAVADRFYPSSKLCNVCKTKCDSLPLSMRMWTCPNCKTVHDRDDNASQNLKTTAEQFAGGKPAESEALVRRPNRTKLPAVKQEPNSRNSAGIPA